jgi:hypothetical protein
LGIPLENRTLKPRKPSTKKSYQKFPKTSKPAITRQLAINSLAFQKPSTTKNNKKSAIINKNGTNMRKQEKRFPSRRSESIGAQFSVVSIFLLVDKGNVNKTWRFADFFI